MSSRLSHADTPKRREVYDLADALLARSISDEDSVRLAQLVAGDSEARRHYVRFMHDSALLGEWGRDSSGVKQIGTDIDFDFVPLNLEYQISNPPFPSLSPLPSPPPLSFVGGPVFSYMVATLILCMMLLGAWVYKISHVESFGPQIANHSKQFTPAFVGQITGMKDCRWKKGSLGTMIGASVSMGREYALSSGLMEIAYTSGARVILEGPCVYKVDSNAGGYLELGKLTARVEHAKSKAVNPEPRNSSLILHPSSLFTVRTPTAIVTDLGTEFGVEVSDEGNTTSHVFRGSVKVQVIGGGPRKNVVLRVNESARVEKGDGASGPRLVLGDKVGRAPTFGRRLYEPPKVIDLLDIVAGGNGTGRHRGRGINPATGMEDPYCLPGFHSGDRQYRTVAWHWLVDGVFVPDGAAGPVQLDSAGHTFDRFPHTNEKAWGARSIWARAAEVKPNQRGTDSRSWTFVSGAGQRFMPAKRGLLVMQPNAGITFDLKTMHRIHTGAVPIRFHAVAGLIDVHSLFPDSINGLADIWVFVDGRLRLKRSQLKPEDGTVNVDVKLSPNDRFLTLVSTDGGNGHLNDWVVFGDPVVQWTLIKSEKEEGSGM